LLIHGRITQIYQSGRIDVDVVEASLDGLVCETGYGLKLCVSIGLKLLRVDLKVVPLNKQRPSIAFLDGSRHHHTEIFSRSLVGVPDLRTSNFKDQGANFSRQGSPENSAGTIIGHSPKINGRHGKIDRNLTPAPGHIEPIDGCRINT
jgi:hypothetical protein